MRERRARCDDVTSKKALIMLPRRQDVASRSRLPWRPVDDFIRKGMLWTNRYAATCLIPFHALIMVYIELFLQETVPTNTALTLRHIFVVLMVL